MFSVPEKFRVTVGPMATNASDENNGCFVIEYGKVFIYIIATDGAGWEHVSVHCQHKNGKQYIPTWEQMNLVKDLFWGDEDMVMQLHPAKSQYINNHPCTLHLWRPIGKEIPSPPGILVGIRDEIIPGPGESIIERMLKVGVIP